MRFSVIIPLYNKELYVRKTLESVISQTFRDYEIIVIDDGSTDNSLAVAKRVLEGIDNCKVLTQMNAGVSIARNNGIAASSGEYICLLDADDWWEPTFLEEMDKLIKDYPNAGLYCTNYYYVHNGKSKIKLDIPTGYFNYCKEYARTLCMTATSSSSSSRKIYDEMGGFNPNLKLGEDFDLWVRIALKYGSAILDKPLVYFNNDLPAAHRATHHLHTPDTHMLWNLDYLEDEEQRNPDYKQLIDNLRVYGLLPYWMSKEHHQAAADQLAKVDWNRQPYKWQRIYKLPVWYLNFRHSITVLGSKVKRAIKEIFK